jgi:hypothetical protein
LRIIAVVITDETENASHHKTAFGDGLWSITGVVSWILTHA